MFIRTITYTDYNGDERTEDFYFNLTRTEMIKMETSVDGGLSAMLKKIINESNISKIIEYLDRIVMAAYGEKAPDGKRFIKSDEISTAFSQSPAYDQLFMEFATNPEKASDFINNLIPEGIADAAEQGKTEAVDNKN